MALKSSDFLFAKKIVDNFAVHLLMESDWPKEKMNLEQQT